MRHFGTYPPDWPAIAWRIKEATGWRCERCHHPAEGPWKMSDMAHAVLVAHASYELDQAPFPGRAACDDLCTHPNNGKQRMLTVHHLDLDKSNCADWNLAALCQGCHLTIQAKVDFRRDWMHEHTDWMKPHVEGRDAAIVAGTWPREIP